MKLRIVPLTQRQAASYIARWHRHHPPSRGDVFRVAVEDEDGEIRGVATIGRPVSRAFDNGRTLEVNRVATDGCPNACSALYGAAWRAAKALGYDRLITYTLKREGGASLRGAGWRVVGERNGRSWAAESGPTRPRDDNYSAVGEQKVLWEAGGPQASMSEPHYTRAPPSPSEPKLEREPERWSEPERMREPTPRSEPNG